MPELLPEEEFTCRCKMIQIMNETYVPMKLKSWHFLNLPEGTAPGSCSGLSDHLCEGGKKSACPARASRGARRHFSEAGIIRDT